MSRLFVIVVNPSVCFACFSGLCWSLFICLSLSICLFCGLSFCLCICQFVFSSLSFYFLVRLCLFSGWYLYLYLSVSPTCPRYFLCPRILKFEAKTKNEKKTWLAKFFSNLKTIFCKHWSFVSQCMSMFIKRYCSWCSLISTYREFRDFFETDYPLLMCWS